MTRRPGEDGVAVVLVLSLVALLVLLALAGGAATAAVAGHRRAQAAADLAALAGAGAGQQGLDACSAAGRIATRNGAAVNWCSVAGADVEVVVAVTMPVLLGGRELRARSRAGPVGQLSARAGTG